jgi:hypothetical protein
MLMTMIFGKLDDGCAELQGGIGSHYNIAVIPARIKHPKDKAPAESSIGWLEVWLLEWLRGKRFHSFEELNTSILARVRELAKRPYQKRPGTREEIFNKTDRMGTVLLCYFGSQHKRTDPQRFNDTPSAYKSIFEDAAASLRTFLYTIIL